MRRLGYLSGAPRVSTHPQAEASGPRAHVVGVIDAFRRKGWHVEPYIVGDLLPERMRVRDASGKLHRSWTRRLGADIARLALAARHERLACRTLRGRVDWVYERLGVFQGLGWPLRARGVPWVVETNAAFFKEAVTDRRSIVLTGVARRRELLAYRRADLIVAVTEALKRTIVDASGVSPEKVIVVPNGVDAHAFRPVPEAKRHFAGPTILFAGALIGYQALDMLLKTVAAADAHGMRWHVVVVGDGLMRQPWAELATRLGLADRVRFTGRLAWHDVNAAIQGADICYSGPVVTQLGVMYHSPLKLYEYMASARPVLAAGHEDASRLVTEGDTGVLFTPGSAASLLDALERAWRLRERWTAMGAAARDLILRDHTWDGRVERIAMEVERRMATPHLHRQSSAA
jgi:glycosyltransferase involved in cell wall biosynthesis